MERILIWPRGSGQAPSPHVDMPEDIMHDYLEASRVLEFSPRSAAALLRLSLQKLMPHIGQTGKNIDQDIKALVQSGQIDPRVQKAADTLRVIGNEAVHPGTMDLKDDITTASSMFKLLNYLVERMISQPNDIDEIFNNLPETKKAGIENRDKPRHV